MFMSLIVFKRGGVGGLEFEHLAEILHFPGRNCEVVGNLPKEVDFQKMGRNGKFLRQFLSVCDSRLEIALKVESTVFYGRIFLIGDTHLLKKGHFVATYIYLGFKQVWLEVDCTISISL